MRFYLGTHETNWLERTRVPLFISRRRLVRRKRLPVARGSWALDSGAFTELKDYGGWTIGAAQYAEEVQRYAAEIGGMEWAAIQDWMCEPFMLERTGKALKEHQELSVQNYLDLRSLAPSMPWVPVLQGFTIDDYLRCIDLYRTAGVDLWASLVGVGSICRRQATREVAELLSTLSGLGLKLHGFGLKTEGLRRCRAFLASADSLAWSFRARRRGRPLRGCTHSSCANCMRFALLWRRRLLAERERRASQIWLMFLV